MTDELKLQAFERSFENQEKVNKLKSYARNLGTGIFCPACNWDLEEYRQQWEDMFKEKKDG